MHIHMFLYVTIQLMLLQKMMLKILIYFLVNLVN